MLILCCCAYTIPSNKDRINRVGTHQVPFQDVLVRQGYVIQNQITLVLCKYITTPVHLYVHLL